MSTRAAALAAIPGGVGELTFEPEHHTYWLGLVQVPSVSEILRPLSEHYLRSVPEDILNWKRDLGTAVHKACELYDLGRLDEDSLDGQIVPYLEGYKRFLADHRPRWSAIEAYVFDREQWYAGTLDRLGELDGAEAVVDIKTSTTVASYAALQLWAYAAAAGAREALLCVLQLAKDGTYRLHEYNKRALYQATWEGLVKVHAWKQENRQ